VFAAFVPSTDIAVKVIGVGMASAIFIDATVVRMLLVPAVMHLLGRWNWWIPAALDRRLPHLAVGGRKETYLPSTCPDQTRSSAIHIRTAPLSSWRTQETA
jgi:RND superfamily putative drug exporter